MDVAAIIATIAGVIKTAVDLGPTVIKLEQDAQPFAVAIYNSLFKGQQITQADLDKLEASIQALSDQLQVPLPADDGTTTS